MSYRYYVGYRPNRSYSLPLTKLAAAAVGFGARALRAVLAKLREKAAIEILSSLDDRTLRDIGVPRSEIHSIAGQMSENPGMNYRVTYRQ